jgi:CDP-diacylglycerol--glycerol-3-phosphate 3-phosphatidyltransferase
VANLADNNRRKNMSLTDFLRQTFKGVLDTLGGFFNRLGIMPNTMTIMGLIGNTIGAYLIIRGEIMWGGILVLIMGPIDALDGTMARLRGQPSQFGAFVDSVTDRYSELVIYGALLVYFLNTGNQEGCILVYLAAAGSVLVSYIRARAEGLGFDAKVGLLTRVERYLVVAPGLVFNFPLLAMGIVAILANFTAVQRIIHVRRQAYLEMLAKKKDATEPINS